MCVSVGRLKKNELVECNLKRITISDLICTKKKRRKEKNKIRKKCKKSSKVNLIVDDLCCLLFHRSFIRPLLGCAYPIPHSTQNQDLAFMKSRPMKNDGCINCSILSQHIVSQDYGYRTHNNTYTCRRFRIHPSIQIQMGYL